MVAEASLSQRSFHQLIVTRLPHHWWDSSCAIVSATRKYLSTTQAFL